MKETVLQLLETANQKFSLIVNENTIQFTIRTYKGISYCTCHFNDELVEAGRKAMPNASIFSKRTNALIGGEFLFRTESGEYPHFSGFTDGKFTLIFIAK